MLFTTVGVARGITRSVSWCRIMDVTEGGQKRSCAARSRTLLHIKSWSGSGRTWRRSPHAKKAELLRWATGSARCPLGVREAARAGRRVEALHADEAWSWRSARTRARPHVLQPHRPAFVRCQRDLADLRSRSRWTRGTPRRFYGLRGIFLSCCDGVTINAPAPARGRGAVTHDRSDQFRREEGEFRR